MTKKVKGKSFFDFSPEEKRDIIETAARESNRMQKEFVEKWNAIRLRKGKPDDVVLDDGDMHLERMTNTVFWLGFYRGGKRTSFFIRSKTKITVEVQENDLEAKMVEQEK